MAEDLQTQLARVQAAIAAIEGGAQEYMVEGRTFRRGDLRMLYEREERLLARIGEQENGTRTYAAWPE